MTDDITQVEADQLFAMEKRRLQDTEAQWPSLGGKASIQLISADGREEFVLDLATSSMKISKLMLQNRARTTAILARLEIDGAPHRNPDDEEVPCPHLHLYREGYNDRWAFPVPPNHFRDLTNRNITFEDFMRFCNVTLPPIFRDGLF